MRSTIAALIAVAGLAACGAPVSRPFPPGAPAPQGGAPNAPGYPPPAAPAPPPPEQPGAPPPHQFHLGAAANALVARAQNEARSGDYSGAGVTLERALRIEPDNPLVWIEYGRVELSAGDAVQADGMGRKALQLATGDRSAQSAAWRLIADALRARGDNQGALEANQHAESLSPR